LGTGIGNYASVANRYRVVYDIPDLPKVPHNIFLYFFGMVGIVGAAGFLWFIYVIVQQVRNHHPKMAKRFPEIEHFIYLGALASLVGYIPNTLTHNVIFSNEFWLSLAFVITSLRLRERETSKPHQL
jgi:O-antigen ligase